MKNLITIIAAVSLGFYFGIRIEFRTHAYKVSQITGTPYLQILDPVGRIIGELR
jgi:hypothetical protein